MPFAIILMTADPNGPTPAYQAAVDASVIANGGRLETGRLVRLPDGGEFRFQDFKFWPTRLSPGLCRIVFDVATQTSRYVDTGGSDVRPMIMKGSAATTPRELGPALSEASPAALCAVLRQRWAGWDHDTAAMRKAGLIGADEQPLGPPSDPGAEMRLSNDPSGVAAHCDSLMNKLAAKMGWPIVRTIVTRNPEWGVVWRADFAPEKDPATWFRQSCWSVSRGGAKPSLRLFSQPLRMFDPTKSISPLPAQ